MARLWMPDWPPASADDKDDEFENSSFDTGAWTEFDQPGTMTVSEGAYGLSLLQTTSAGDNITGIFRAIPTGDWAIWTKCGVSCLRANYIGVGLMLGADLTNNPSTSDIVSFSLTHSASAVNVDVIRWNAYNSYNAGLASLSDVLFTTHVYLRIRKASTTYFFDYSTDGIGWQEVYTTASLPITPAEMGLYLNNVNSGSTIRGVFQFFRCVDGTPALTDVMGGQRVL